MALCGIMIKRDGLETSARVHFVWLISACGSQDNCLSQQNARLVQLDNLNSLAMLAEGYVDHTPNHKDGCW